MIKCRIFTSSNGKTEIKERKTDGRLTYINIAKVQPIVKEIFGIGAGEGLADGDARGNAILFVNTLPRENVVSICESHTDNGLEVTVYYHV